MRKGRIVACLLAPCLVIIGTAVAQDRPGRTAPTVTYEAPPRDKADAPRPALRLGLADAAPPLVVLGPLDTSGLAAEDAARAQSGAPMRIGVPRDIRIGSDSGTWHDVSGDGLWLLAIQSPGALAIQLHLSGLDLPPGARLDVVAADGTVVQTIRSRGHREDGALWTAPSRGETLRLELYVPAAQRGAAPGFEIDGLQHLYRGPGPAARDGGPVAKEGSCHNDVTCFPAWATVAKAVGWINFVADDGFSSVCTGQLLASESGDQTPYFLTASHCVHSVDEAASVTVYWFYQTSQCDGQPPDPFGLPSTSGSELLYTTWTPNDLPFEPPAHPDATLLLLSGSVAPGVTFVGWSTAETADGTDVVGIHHPAGAFKRISFAKKTGNIPSHLLVTWSDGVVEGGSSGSGLYIASSQLLIGQLWGGVSGCSGPFGPDYYGDFRETFLGIADFIATGTDDPFDPNDTCTEPSAITPGRYEDLIVKNAAEDWYSIAVPAGTGVGVAVRHSNANGDIDLQLLSACGQPPLASARTSEDIETVSWTNTGGATSVLLRVYLARGTRNRYDMTISLCDNDDPPAGVNATDSTLCEGVRITWQTDPLHVNYGVWRSTSDDSATAALLKTVDAPPYVDGSADPGRIYYYWVRWNNGCGSSRFGEATPGRRGAPPPPAASVAAADGATCSNVTVTWTAVAGATSYDILRNTTDNGSTATKVASTPSSPYVDSSAVAGARYYYWVRAINACGAGALSEPDSGFRLRPPTPPSSVSASKGTPCDHIALTWSAVSDAADYEVLRSETSASANAISLGTTSETELADADNEAGRTYYYWIRARNSCGVSTLSLSTSGTRSGAPSAPSDFTVSDGTLTDRVQITWNASRGTAQYAVLRGTSSDPATAVEIGRTTGTAFDDREAVEGVAYYYWLQALSECAGSPLGAPKVGRVLSKSAAADAASRVNTDTSTTDTTTAPCGLGSLFGLSLTLAGLTALRRRR